MKRLKVNYIALLDPCEKCSDEKLSVGVAGKTAYIEDDFVYTVTAEKRHVGEGYDYVMLNGKKLRFELVETKDE